MPTTTLIGVSAIHFFDFQSWGWAKFSVSCRKMWASRTDVRNTLDEYPQYRSTKIQVLNPTASIPVVELNGRILTQIYAMLRHFVTVLECYDGHIEEERYWTDVVCDIVIDCKLSLLFLSCPVYVYAQFNGRFDWPCQSVGSSSRPSSSPNASSIQIKTKVHRHPAPPLVSNRYKP